MKARAETLRLARADYDRALDARGGVGAGEVDACRSRYAVAQSDWDKAKSELDMLLEGTRQEDKDAAAAQVQVAQAKLRAAEAELAKTRLTVPNGGQVLQVFAEPGELATPNSAQPILIVADLSRRRVRAFIEELDVDRVQLGQPAVVTADGLPGKSFTGKVGLILPRMGKRAPQSDAPNENEGPLLPRSADRPGRRQRTADEPAGTGPHPGNAARLTGRSNSPSPPGWPSAESDTR